jgi:hypothetical protein
MAKVKWKSQPIKTNLKRRQNMTDTNAVIASYANHAAAEDAVKELQKSGFDMKKLSVVGKDYHTDEQVVGYYNAGDRMKYWGKLGAFWGGFWGLLFGGAFFWVPAIGHRCRSVQHRYTKKQHRDLRDRHKGGGVSGSCSWNFRRGG